MRGLLKAFVWVGVLGALVFYGVGGWYFSNELIADAFVAEPSMTEYPSQVTAIDGNVVSVMEVAHDPEVLEAGVFGLDWADGYGRVGDIDSLGGGVTANRLIDRSIGGWDPGPGIGTAVNVDSYAYPDQVPDGWEEIAIEGPLGAMPAWQGAGSEELWVIHVHGKGAPLREALRAAVPLYEAGYPQLIISYRNDVGSPTDPSGYYQYGVTERDDLVAAIDYARVEGAGQIVLAGYSTGAAVIGGYLAGGGDTSDISGLIFDSPNIDFATTVDFNASQRDLPLIQAKVPASLAWVARMITAFRIGVDWDAMDYTARLAGSGLPILVWHGTDDSTVPILTSQRLANAANVELITVPGAEHVGSWNSGPEPYTATLLETVATFGECQALSCG